MGGAAPVLAVDGGNSKTDVALVAADGTLLAALRGPTISHQAVGIDEGMRRLAGLVRDAFRAAAHRGARSNPGAEVSARADVAVLALAGADLPSDVRLLTRRTEELGVARRTLIVNDALAALRAGSDDRWGVALICGKGTNGIGVAPNGRTARFDALGPVSGDWGGAGDIGWAALAAAVRSRDGRGRPTTLSRAVPAHFGRATPSALTRALYLGRVPTERLSELAPVVVREAAAGDPVARQILDRQADELVAMAAALIRRLRMERLSFHVVLAGGVFRADDEVFPGRLARGVRDVAPNATIVRLDAPPVFGAALLALDELTGSRTDGGELRGLRDGLRRFDRDAARARARPRDGPARA